MKRTTGTLILVAALSALILSACGNNDDAADTTTPAAAAAVPQTYEEFRAQPTACGADAPSPVVPMQFDQPGDLGLDPTAKVPMSIVTSCGSIDVDSTPPSLRRP